MPGVLAAAFGACAGNSEAGPPAAAALSGDAASGRVVYDEHCASCHQLDGSGLEGRQAADLRELRGSDLDLLLVIRDGRLGPIGVMPGFGARLIPQDQAHVLAYLRAGLPR